MRGARSASRAQGDEFGAEFSQQVTRNRAADAWSDAYQGAASTLEGLYRVAGFPELAEKVRPTQRKMRGEDSGDETNAPPAPAPATSSENT